MFCAKCGKTILDEHGTFCAYCGSPLVRNQSQSHNDADERIPINSRQMNKKTTGIIWATSLFYIHSALWTFVCIFQWIAVLMDYNVSPLLAFWNMGVTIFCYFISHAIYKQKKWGYYWGIGTSFINILSTSAQIVSLQVSFIFIVLVAIDIAIFIILRANKHHFGFKRPERKSVIEKLRTTQADIEDEKESEVNK